MRISIVTVSFNSISTIADTLDSVAQQSHSDIEHVVIDGGSTDGTVDLIRSRGSRVSVFVTEPDAGIYDAMNKGLALANGEAIGFLNSDDFFATPDAVSSIARTLATPTVDVVHGNLVYVRRDDPLSVLRYWKASQFSPGAFSRAWCPAHPTFYAKRDVLAKTGRFNTSLRVASDLDLMFRILEIQRARSVVIPEVLVKMRAGGVSNSSVAGVFRQNTEVIRSIRSHGLKVNLPVFVAAKIVRRAAQFVARPKRQMS